eukprot:TRINITY_DN91_c0_g1_i1.p1 TRINITY_DN91_c0_g1~~TRINITY_DN91_c0_g1_i1.p1  ORF type:complete len:523 (+),score=87.66 TRINITY_DN91_c0_g1_i1:77-1645(+)
MMLAVVFATAVVATGAETGTPSAIAAPVPPSADVDVSSFGPSDCVTVSRSVAKGSCILDTGRCEGQDISTVEFAFICEGDDGEVIRHSFGVGGFDVGEVFDTEARCGRCQAPRPIDERLASAPPATQRSQTREVTAVVASSPLTSVSHNAIPAGSAGATLPTPSDVVLPALGRRLRRTHKSSSPVESRKEGENEEVRYGPKKCVSTRRSKEHRCIIQTRCKAADIKDFEFGLICEEKAGTFVRHLFGKNSFDPEETFDTLIVCERCLGLEETPESLPLATQVKTLSKQVAELRSDLMGLNEDVSKLTKVVEGRENDTKDEDSNDTKDEDPSDTKDEDPDPSNETSTSKDDSVAGEATQFVLAPVRHQHPRNAHAVAMWAKQLLREQAEEELALEDAEADEGEPSDESFEMISRAAARLRRRLRRARYKRLLRLYGHRGRMSQRWRRHVVPALAKGTTSDVSDSQQARMLMLARRGRRAAYRHLKRGRSLLHQQRHRLQGHLDESEQNPATVVDGVPISTDED